MITEEEFNKKWGKIVTAINDGKFMEFIKKKRKTLYDALVAANFKYSFQRYSDGEYYVICGEDGNTLVMGYDETGLWGELLGDIFAGSLSDNSSVRRQLGFSRHIEELDNDFINAKRNEMVRVQGEIVLGRLSSFNGVNIFRDMGMSIFKEDFKTFHGIFGSSSLVEQIFKVNVEGRKPIMDLYNISEDDMENIILAAQPEATPEQIKAFYNEYQKKISILSKYYEVYKSLGQADRYVLGGHYMTIPGSFLMGVGAELDIIVPKETTMLITHAEHGAKTVHMIPGMYIVEKIGRR